MSQSKLSKISRQSSETWSSLHRRMMIIDFNYSEIFSTPVTNFIHALANSVSTSVGYLMTAILVGTGFVLSQKATLQVSENQTLQSNIYAIFVGPPSTGKSQALKIGVKQPLCELKASRGADFTLLEKTTSAGLMKTLSSSSGGIIISPEIGEDLIKLVRPDSDTYAGDSSVLCELFSGESASVTLATSPGRFIKENYPFCIIGASQMLPLVKLMTVMEQGQGLFDRFILTAPMCLRPTPEETSAAIQTLKGMDISDVGIVYETIFDLHFQEQMYTLDNEAQKLYTDLKKAFIDDINEALLNGTVPPRSKKVDIVGRMALSIHVFDAVARALLSGENCDIAPSINHHTLKSALALVEFSDCQKTILIDALDEILLPTRDDVKAQPSLEEVKEATLTSLGPVTTARSFKQGAPRHYRSTTSAEFSKAIEGMLDYGTVLGIRVPRRALKVKVFCKKSPDVLQERWPSDAPCSFQSYSGAFKKNLPTAISDYMNIELNKKGFL